MDGDDGGTTHSAASAVMVARWLQPDFQIVCVWPYGLEGLWLRYAALQNFMPSTLAQSKERKGSNFAAQRSGAIVQKPKGPNTYNLKIRLQPSGNHDCTDEQKGGAESITNQVIIRNGTWCRRQWAKESLPYLLPLNVQLSKGTMAPQISGLGCLIYMPQ